jgi:hypothetical protein
MISNCKNRGNSNRAWVMREQLGAKACQSQILFLVVPAPVPCAFLVPAAFLPGLPSTSPTSFSAVPTTLSLAFSVGVRLFFTTLVFGPVVVAFGFVTRPPVVRGLEVLAVAVVRFFGATAFSICCTRRGLLLPVLARVDAGMLADRGASYR